MVRAISVILAVLVLLSVGWYFGHRPVRVMEDRLEREAAAWHDREAELVRKADTAEARGLLRIAEAELLLAAHDADARNFGLAGSRARRAQDLVIRAIAVPGTGFELGSIRDQIEAAHARAEASDPRAADLLLYAAEELRRFLEQAGRA